MLQGLLLEHGLPLDGHAGRVVEDDPAVRVSENESVDSDFMSRLSTLEYVSCPTLNLS